MNRSEKVTFVSDLRSDLDKAQAVAVLSFNKLSVEQMTSFRLGLAKKDVRVKVVKNTLAKRVFDGTTFSPMATELKGPTLLAYSGGDPVLTAKSVTEWLDKEGFDVKFKVGTALGQLLNPTQMKALSKLPGKNELFVSFLWALKSHPTRFLYALQDTPRKLGYALAALKDKKEKAA